MPSNMGRKSEKDTFLALFSQGPGDIYINVYKVTHNSLQARPLRTYFTGVFLFYLCFVNSSRVPLSISDR